MVIAGDTHPDPEIRRQVLTTIEDELGLPVIHVNGNHDYYGGSFPNDGGELVTMGRIRFAVATLWTYLDDRGRHEAARFPDFVKIQGATVDKWNDLHLAQLAFLEQAEADVIVTHHAPFPSSIHEDFQGDALNAFFVNNLDPQRFPKTRLWLHGHVHTPFDYLVSTRGPSDPRHLQSPGLSDDTGPTAGWDQDCRDWRVGGRSLVLTRRRLSSLLEVEGSFSRADDFFDMF